MPRLNRFRPSFLGYPDRSKCPPTYEEFVKPRLIAISVFSLILASTWIIDGFARDAHLSEVRSEISAEVDTLARDLSDVIARETASVDTLAAFVEITKDDQSRMAAEFPVFAQALLESGETVRAIQMAPDSVIRFVYPLEGNEAAVGLNLMADPDRRALLTPAIENATTVIQGPVELVQGGLGLLVRKPIYNDDGSYWGLAAVLLDWEAVATGTDLDNMRGDIIAGARLPNVGTILAGESSAFDGDPVIRTIRVGATDTEWKIAVRPAEGWPTTAPATQIIWAIGLIAATTAALAAFSLAARPAKLRREREKAREELAIAEARYESTFRNAGVGIAVIRIEGRLITANPAFRKLIDLPDDAPLVGISTRDLVDPDHLDGHEMRMKALRSGAPVVHGEMKLNVTGDRWCRSNVTVVKGEGEERLLIAILEDITVRRNAEMALADSESRFRQLYEQAPIAIQREDHSSVVEKYKELREQGVTDIRAYFEENPGYLHDLLSGVRIIDANPAAVRLQGHLERSQGQLTLLDRMTRPSESSFVETLVAIWEQRTSLEQSVETVGPDDHPLFLDVRWHAPLDREGRADYSKLMVTIADITELRDAQNQLEDLIRSKDRFLASVAHELRTPLTAVVGFAQELKDELGVYQEGDKEEFRELIAHHSAELSNIIEDLLVWARGDIGEVRVSPEKVDLGEGVKRTLDGIHNIDLEVSEPDGRVVAYADPTRLRQIVRNLITNAMRYGGDDVGVEVRVHEAEAVVEVSDNGPRLTEADMDRIFEPYTRSEVVTVAPGSIGLGLTVSRSLARLQGGDLVCLRVDDRNVFRVSLPQVTEALLVDTAV